MSSASAPPLFWQKLLDHVRPPPPPGFQPHLPSPACAKGRVLFPPGEGGLHLSWPRIAKPSLLGDSGSLQLNVAGTSSAVVPAHSPEHPRAWSVRHSGFSLGQRIFIQPCPSLKLLGRKPHPPPPSKATLPPAASFIPAPINLTLVWGSGPPTILCTQQPAALEQGCAGWAATLAKTTQATQAFSALP